MSVYGTILCLALLGILVCTIHIAWSWVKARNASRIGTLLRAKGATRICIAPIGEVKTGAERSLKANGAGQVACDR